VATPATMPALSLRLSDFAVMGSIGEGGQGKVLLAKLKTSGQLYAMKLPFKERLNTTAQAERVLREAHALQEAKHPFIIELLGAFQDEEYVYLLLEYAGGGDLYTRLDSLEAGMEMNDVRVAVAEVSLALSHLHRLGYMYRDLKAENVLVANDGHLKLADFGLVKKFLRDKTPDGSRSNTPTKPARRSTRRHTAVGTPDAVPPEVLGIGLADGVDDYGTSVDWWGLGILVTDFFLGVGGPLVACGADDRGISMLMESYRHGRHLDEKKMSQLPPLAADLVRRLLAVKVSERLCGLDELRKHAFFQGFDWDELSAKQMPPPMQPLILSAAVNAGGNGNGGPTEGGGSYGRNLFRRQSSEGVMAIEANLIAFLDSGAQGELCEAASRNDLLRLQELIDAGVDPNSYDYDRRTALHIAASEGHMETTKFLLSTAKAYHSPKDRWGSTPLDDARRGESAEHKAVAEYLHECGATAHRGANRGIDNPQANLCEAASKGDISELRHLVTNGLDVNEGDYDKRTALHLAASEGVLDAVQFLINEARANHSPVDRWGGTPLDDAIRQKHQPVEKFLRGAGASEGTTGMAGGTLLPTANSRDIAGDLCEAAAKGDTSTLAKMMATGSLQIDINKGDYDRRTALHLACSEGQLEAVRFLIEQASADPSPIDRWGGTPLDDSIRQEHHPVAIYLKSKGAKLGATARIRLANLAADLCAAAHEGDVARLRMLVKEDKADPNMGDYDRRRALHLAACEGLLPAVDVLLSELQANPNVCDRWGNTPLDDAKRSGHDAVVARLRRAGGKEGACYVGNSKTPRPKPAGGGRVTFEGDVTAPEPSPAKSAESSACALL